MPPRKRSDLITYTSNKRTRREGVQTRGQQRAQQPNPQPNQGPQNTRANARPNPSNPGPDARPNPPQNPPASRQSPAPTQAPTQGLTQAPGLAPPLYTQRQADVDAHTQFTGGLGAQSYGQTNPGFSSDEPVLGDTYSVNTRDVEDPAEGSELSDMDSNLEVPTELQHTDSASRQYLGGKLIGEGDLQEPIYRFDYSWVNFQHPQLAGFRKLLHQIPLRQRAWRYGVPLELKDSSSTQRWFLCHKCHDKGEVRLFRSRDGLSSAKRHLQLMHGDEEVNQPQKDSWMKVLYDRLEAMHLDPKNPKDMDVMEHMVKAFNPTEFQARARRWFIGSHIPFQRIEDSGFLEMCVSLQPLVKAPNAIPCRQTLRQKVIEDLQVHKEEIRARLKDAPGKIHISSDIWTARNNHAYNGVVAHWVDGEGQYFSCLLALSPMYESHCGANIAKDTLNALDDYHITQKLGYVTTDNASNNDTAMDHLSELLHKKGVKFNAEWRRIRCFGHILNLIARTLLYGQEADRIEVQTQLLQDQSEAQEIAAWDACGVVGRLHNIVKWIRKSPQRNGRWMNCQERTRIRTSSRSPKALELVPNNDTRWNSTYKMIKRATELQSELNTFLQEEQTIYTNNVAAAHRRPKNTDSLSRRFYESKIPPEDWKQLHDLLKILDPIHHATKLLEGHPGAHLFCNLGFVIPTFEFILKGFEDLVQEHYDKPLLLQCINAAWEKANEYYSLLDRSPAYVAAVVLDHRFGWQFLENHWEAEHPDWLRHSRELIRALWEREYNHPDPEIILETILVDPLPPPQRQENDFLTFIKSNIKKSRKTRGDAAPYDEYEKWCMEDLDDDDLDLTPMEYWSKRSIQSAYPRLSRMALDILSIPPMSSEPERIFSLAGVLLRDRRSRLKDDIVEASELLSNWQNRGLIQIGAYSYTDLQDDSSGSSSGSGSSVQQ